jgi:hypothetical protein
MIKERLVFPSSQCHNLLLFYRERRSIVSKSNMFESTRFEIVIAVLIAVVSLTTALSAWRTNVVGSSAGDATRQGLIDAVKRQTSANEDWRKVYQEADYAQTFSVYQAVVDALNASGDQEAAHQATNLRQYLLPNLQLLSQPLGTDEKYIKPDGTYDLEKRFADLEAETPDLAKLDPLASFKLADQYSGEQRWLTIGTILLAVSLFWLALAEVGRGRMRLVTVPLGIGVYLVGLALIFFVEVIYFFLRGGAL